MSVILYIFKKACLKDFYLYLSILLESPTWCNVVNLFSSSMLNVCFIDLTVGVLTLFVMENKTCYHIYCVKAVQNSFYVTGNKLFVFYYL